MFASETSHVHVKVDHASHVVILVIFQKYVLFWFHVQYNSPSFVHAKRDLPV